MENDIFISFVCQRCLQPLCLDHTFSDIGEHKIAELSLPLYSSRVIELELHVDYDHFIPPFSVANSSNGSNGFTLIDDAGSCTLSHHIKLAAGLFDIISGNTEISHPLCEECTDTLLEMMDKHFRMVEDDYSHYKLYLKKLNKGGDNDLLLLSEEMGNLQKEETRLFEELKSFQEEEKLIQHDISEAESYKENIEREEQRFWRQYNKYSRDLFSLEDEYRSTEFQANYAQFHLDRLKKTNVFNTTFHIWHKGHFGTINNFRLGRLPSAPVDWSEINAAWGQTTLLLVALAQKSNLTFQKYRLVPYGSLSYIEVLADHKELPLYGSGGFRFLLNPKFDSAMVAFLDCLQQFKEEVEKGESGFNLPYHMERGRIKDSGTGKSYSVANIIANKYVYHYNTFADSSPSSNNLKCVNLEENLHPQNNIAIL